MSDIFTETMDEADYYYSAGLAHSAARIEELEAKLEKLERWQAAAFIAHGNLDLDIEANPEALAELKRPPVK